MIWLLVFAAVFGGLGYIAYKNSKNSTKMYSKLAALALFFLSVFYLYQFVYYTQVGNDIAKFYAGGAGVEYTDNTTGNTTTFYSTSEEQMGEYFAMQRANRDVLTILSANLPIFAIFLAGYLIWYYVETGMRSRDRDRMT